jgi:hypothetical protein
MNRKQITEAMKAGETVVYSRYGGTAQEVVGNGFRSGNRYFETSQYSVRVSPVVLDAVLGG